MEFIEDSEDARRNLIFISSAIDSAILPFIQFQTVFVFCFFFSLTVIKRLSPAQRYFTTINLIVNKKPIYKFHMEL